MSHRQGCTELLALTFAAAPAACFAEPSDVDSAGEAASVGSNADASELPGSGSDGETATDAATSASDTSNGPGTTTEAGSSGDEAGGSSSSGDPPPGFCDVQPEQVVLCRDFDGQAPLSGVSVFEMSGSVSVTEVHAVSAPAAMQVSVHTNPAGASDASISQTVYGAGSPFSALLAAQVWIEGACFDDGGERLVLALGFFDAADPDGPFLFNLTLWSRPFVTTLYESDQPAGYPSTPHEIDFVFPTDQWVPIAIEFTADSADVAVSLDDTTTMVALELLSPAVTAEIADVEPGLTVGTTMQANGAPCTMYYDDATVTAL